MKAQQNEPNSSVDWTVLVAKIRGNDPKGKEELQCVFSHGIRFFLNRQLGPQQLDARVEETFTILINTVKLQGLGEYNALVRLVGAIVQKQIAAYRDQDQQNRSQHVGETPVVIPDYSHPGVEAIHHKNAAHMVTVIRSMSVRNQEAIIRFYCHQHTQENICEEMQISETQFRGIKAHFKAMFKEEASRSLVLKNYIAADDGGSQSI